MPFCYPTDVKASICIILHHLGWFSDVTALAVYFVTLDLYRFVLHWKNKRSCCKKN